MSRPPEDWAPSALSVLIERIHAEVDDGRDRFDFHKGLELYPELGEIAAELIAYGRWLAMNDLREMI